MAIIAAKNLTFKYDTLNKPTLIDFDFEIEAGEKVLIAGPSGCGKSTLAHLINGLIPFTYAGSIEGELIVDGIKPYEHSIYDVSEHVGTILQDPDSQFVALTVGEDVAFVHENQNVPVPKMHEDVQRTLEWMEMWDFRDHTPQNLSGGQRQKVAMAGILASQTPILLFDEPLANLDPLSGVHAMNTIDHIHERTGKTVVVIEHRIEDVIEHDFDRIIVIKENSIIANDTPDAILASDVLDRAGLREPLYLEAVKNCGIDVSRLDGLSHIESCMQFKEHVTGCLAATEIPAVPPNDDVVLRARDVSFRYFKDEPQVVRDVSFDVKRGEFLAIMGNNGAGKSTILRLLTGFLKVEQGSLEHVPQGNGSAYRGVDITKQTIMERAKIIGYVMQNPNHMITKHMLRDEIAFGLVNNGWDEDAVAERVEYILKVCGLHGYRNWPISSLSYGQKKRATIASILAMGPEVILLDEPTAGQDQANYSKFMTFLERVKAEGVAVVMVTHDMQLCLEYADRGIVLCNGEVIADDSIYKVFADNDLLKRANLKRTSISTLATMYGIEDRDRFMAYFVQRLKEVGTIE